MKVYQKFLSDDLLGAAEDRLSRLSIVTVTLRQILPAFNVKESRKAAMRTDHPVFYLTVATSHYTDVRSFNTRLFIFSASSHFP